MNLKRLVTAKNKQTKQNTPRYHGHELVKVSLGKDGGKQVGNSWMLLNVHFFFQQKLAHKHHDSS